MEPSNMAGRGHSALQGSQNSIIREHTVIAIE